MSRSVPHADSGMPPLAYGTLDAVSPIRDVLQRALPGAKLTERKGEIEVLLPGGPPALYRIVTEADGVGGTPSQTVLYAEHADPRTLTALREARSSFVTAQGIVFLVGPGLYVDVRPPRALSDPDRTRNPFSTGGRRVCVSLLLHPERDWTVRDLATASSVSESFVSRVVGALEDQGFVEVDARRFRPRAEFLFAALAEHWPKPSAFFSGRAPTGKGDAVIGGGPAYEKLGLVVPALPRAYVPTRDRLRSLIVQTNSTASTSRMAQWEAVIQPLPLTNGLAPGLICALELARDVRGREVLRNRDLVPWPIHV